MVFLASFSTNLTAAVQEARLRQHLERVVEHHEDGIGAAEVRGRLKWSTLGVSELIAFAFSSRVSLRIQSRCSYRAVSTLFIVARRSRSPRSHCYTMVAQQVLNGCLAETVAVGEDFRCGAGFVVFG